MVDICDKLPVILDEEVEVVSNSETSLSLVVVEPTRGQAETNPALVYLASLSETGRLTMRQKLNRVAGLLSNDTLNLDTFNWPGLDYPTMQLLRTLLREKANYKPATANTALTAVKRVLKECVRLKLISNDTYLNVTDIPAHKNDTLPRGRSLSTGELTALMLACTTDNSNASIRNAAMIVVMYGAGLRRSEVVALDLADFNRDTGALTIQAGKGHKDRITYLGTTAPLEDWISIRGFEPGPLFFHINKGDRIETTRLSNSAVTHMIIKVSKLAGVQHFSAHDMRRSFISDLLDAGADIATAQKLAGHANVTTTARYDRRGEVTKKKAAGLLHVSYQRQHQAVEREADLEQAVRKAAGEIL